MDANTEVNSSIFIGNAGSVVLCPVKEDFVASEKFVVDIEPIAAVKIFSISRSFEMWFLGKVEKPRDKKQICYRDLKTISDDSAIIAEIGREKVETGLSDIYILMAVAERKGNGVLVSNNHHFNVFYAMDVNNELREVILQKCDEGYRIDADSLDHSIGFYDGDRIFYSG